jgi:hypothetical protein
MDPSTVCLQSNEDDGGEGVEEESRGAGRTIPPAMAGTRARLYS